MRRTLSAVTAVLCTLAVAPAAAQAVNPDPPAVNTGAVSAIAQTTATLGGAVNPGGAPTKYHFEYGTTESYGLTTPEQSAGEGTSTVPVTQPITGLTPSTIYHYRLVAQNDAGVTNGTDKTFKTLATPQPPAVTGKAATGVGANGATLPATLDPRGLDTTWRFEYGTTTAYGSATPDTLATGTGGRAIAGTLAGLTPNTTYHFRLVATNAAGTVRTKDRTLRTKSAPTGITITASTTATMWGGNVALRGMVSGNGVGGIGLAVVRTDFPFTGTPLTLKTFSATSTGTYAVSVGPFLTAAHVRVVTRTASALSSPTVTIGVRPRVVARTTSPRRTSILVSGSVTPALSKGTVSIQQRSRSGRWSTVARGRLSTRTGASGSTFAVRIRRPSRPAFYQAVVLPNDGGAHLRGSSKRVKVKAAKRARG